jgi:hypothetical protein
MELLTLKFPAYGTIIKRVILYQLKVLSPPVWQYGECLERPTEMHCYLQLTAKGKILLCKIGAAEKDAQYSKKKNSEKRITLGN